MNKLVVVDTLLVKHEVLMAEINSKPRVMEDHIAKLNESMKVRLSSRII